MIGILLLMTTLTSGEALALSCTDVSLAEAGAQMRHCGNLKVVRISGTTDERARQFGSLVKTGAIGTGTLDYFAGILDDKLKNTPPIFRGIAKGLYSFWRWSRQRPDSPELSRELRVFAEAAELDFATLRRAVSIPDFSVFLNGKSGRLVVQPDGMPHMGCTSVARRFDDGSFVVGRNLDFAGVRVWDKEPLLVYHEPEPGSDELKHVALSSAPLYFGSITGVNEAGITLAVHENFTSDVEGRGYPVFLIGERVLRRARTLEQGIELLKKFRPAPLWTFVLTNLNSGQAVAVESSANHFFVRKLEGRIFGQTNHLLAANPADIERLETIGFTTYRNSLFRLRTVLDKAAQAAPDSAVETVAGILAHQAERDSNTITHRDILKAITIQSVIFHRAADGSKSLYLAAESAPVSGGQYVRLNLDRLFQGGDLSALEYEGIDPLRLSPQVRLQQLALSEAYAAAWDRGDQRAAIQHLESLPGAGPRLISAILHYELAEYPQAQGAAEQGLELELSKPVSERDTHAVQALQSILLLAMYRLDRHNPVLKIEAAALLRETLENPAMRRVARRLQAGQPLSGKDQKVNYDWFGGDLRWGAGM